MRIFCVLLVSLLLFTGCSDDGLFKKEISLRASGPIELSIPVALNPGGYSHLPNQLYGWGMKKNVNAPPDIPSATKELIKKYNACYLDTVPHALYLTFDEGYENGYTGKILDILKENQAPAAFFITGPYLDKETELVKRMIDEGHIVGNHTIHHPSLPTIANDSAVAEEITDLNKKFNEKFGLDMKYIRAPRGEYSERTLAISNDLGYINVFWSFAYRDWEVDKQRGTEYAYDQIMKGVHDGAVLLLHAVSKDNANVLDKAIKDLKAQGYHFKSLDDFGK